jgi:hypothetical protein
MLNHFLELQRERAPVIQEKSVNHNGKGGFRPSSASGDSLGLGEVTIKDFPAELPPLPFV